MEDTMDQKTTFTVTGMSCGHCEMAVTKSLKSIPGVSDVEASHEKDIVVISHTDDLDRDVVKQKVAEAGYSLGE